MGEGKADTQIGWAVRHREWKRVAKGRNKGRDEAFLGGGRAVWEGDGFGCGGACWIPTSDASLNSVTWVTQIIVHIIVDIVQILYTHRVA